MGTNVWRELFTESGLIEGFTQLTIHPPSPCHFIHASICLFLLPFNHPFIHPSIHLPIHPSIPTSSIRPSTHSLTCRMTDASALNLRVTWKRMSCLKIKEHVQVYRVKQRPRYWWHTPYKYNIRRTGNLAKAECRDEWIWEKWAKGVLFHQWSSAYWTHVRDSKKRT